MPTLLRPPIAPPPPGSRWLGRVIGVAGVLFILSMVALAFVHLADQSNTPPRGTEATLQQLRQPVPVSAPTPSVGAPVSSDTITQDRDHDGLTDAEEQLIGTNPDNPDTDGDGYSDAVEVTSGHNPLVPTS